MPSGAPSSFSRRRREPSSHLRTPRWWRVRADLRRLPPRPGRADVVDLTGPVRPAPQDPAQTLNLEAADAQVVEQQGGYVNADEVQPVQ